MHTTETSSSVSGGAILIVPHKYQVSRKIFSLISICFLFVALLGTYENHDLKLHRWYLWSVASKNIILESSFAGNTKINIIGCHELKNHLTMSKFCMKYLHKLGNHNKSPYLSNVNTCVDYLVLFLLHMAKIALTDPYFELHNVMTHPS